MNILFIIVFCIGLFLLFGLYSILPIIIILLSYKFLDFKKVLGLLKNYLK